MKSSMIMVAGLGVFVGMLMRVFGMICAVIVVMLIKRQRATRTKRLKLWDQLRNRARRGAFQRSPWLYSRLAGRCPPDQHKGKFDGH